MNITILTLGTRGDVQPYLALSKALQKRGHNVLLCAPDNFQQWVESHQVPFVASGVDIQDLLQSPEVKKVMSGQWFRIRKIWKERIVPMMEQSLEAIWEASQTADVILYHPKVYGAIDIAEATGAKLICASLVPLFPTRDFPLLVWNSHLGSFFNRLSYQLISTSRLPYMKLIRRWRQNTLGLKSKAPGWLRIGRDYQNKPVTSLCAVSPSVIPRPDDWSNEIHMVGYWFLEDDPNWQPDENLSKFLEQGEPPIYIGFGSMTQAEPEKIGNMIIKAVEELGIRAIVAKGWGGIELKNTSENVYFLDQAPHDVLFRYVKAVVHHGGAGTTAAGLRAGCPTWICPTGMDQPFWGNVIYKSQCGPKPVKLNQLTYNVLLQSLKNLVTQSQYADNADFIAQRLRQENGIQKAVRIIESK